MEIKIDSSPCADDHSSPRSPLHVLAAKKISIGSAEQTHATASYPRIDLESLATADNMDDIQNVAYKQTFPPA